MTSTGSALTASQTPFHLTGGNTDKNGRSLETDGSFQFYLSGIMLLRLTFICYSYEARPTGRCI